MSPQHYLALAALLFTIGTAGVLIRRNVLIVLMSIELMLNAVNLALVTFSNALRSPEGQVLVFFAMIVAAAEVAVGLALVVALFRLNATTNLDDFQLMKW
ncbi:MAG: NADH-quinone oxidoreductase subunit NuoK [candidate division KSB1 bacterium]|nr:NADH-quinone oxidoreductase subunit NuoK [candidate division KSB1 bacterium]